MKKILSFALALALCAGLAAPAFAAGGTAYASTQSVEVDGKKVEFQMYALRDAAGNGTNYVKLRDVAHVLNGTPAQFSVGYDSASGSILVTTGAAYADTGTEMTTPYSGDRTYQTGSGAVLVDGRAASLDAIVLTDDAGGGYTYFKLRDLGTALGFTVDWSAGGRFGEPNTYDNQWYEWSGPVVDKYISDAYGTSSNYGCGGFAKPSDSAYVWNYLHPDRPQTFVFPSRYPA